MSLDNLMLSVLFRKGRTLHMELRSFKILLALKDTISKVGYLKQRLKLNPVAFLALARHHAESFYNDTKMVKKKNGYLIKVPSQAVSSHIQARTKTDEKR